MRNTLGIVSAVAMMLTPLQVHADDQDSIAAGSIINELSCRREPNGFPAAAYLAKKRYIKLKDNVGADSVSCWKLARTFDLDGLPVDGFCTFSEDALMHLLWPDVFYRGPGTSPGPLVSVSSATDRDAVQSWASKRGLKDANIGASDWFDGMTQVECRRSSAME